MDKVAGRPEVSVSGAGDFRVGEHVHQLLSIAGALVRSASRAGAVSGVVVEDVTAGVGFSAGGGLPFGVDLGALSDRECVGWAQDLERLAKIGQAMAVQVAAELVQRTEAGRYANTGVRGPVDLLVQSLQVSAGEAHRRVRLAEAVLPVLDPLCGVLSPARQHVLGEVFFRGEVSQEQALLVSGFVDEAARLVANGRIDQDCFVDVETTLVEAGQGEDPDCLRRIGNRIMSHLGASPVWWTRLGFARVPDCRRLLLWVPLAGALQMSTSAMR